MTDDEFTQEEQFMQEEQRLLSAMEAFVRQCEKNGFDAKDRLDDLVFRALSKQ